MALTVTIGNKVGEKDMAHQTWQRFQLRTLKAIQTFADEIYFVGQGNGIYANRTERAFTVIASDVNDQDMVDLKEQLGHLATIYRQECIAVTQGNTDMVDAGYKAE